MLRGFILSCFFVLAARARQSASFGVPHEKIAQIFSDIDYNKNDVITQNEVLSYFELFKHDPHAEMIQKSMFVSVWTKKYDDSHVVAESLYGKLDANRDGILSNSDVPAIFDKVDTDRNGIDWHEFETAVNAWYSEM